MSESNPLAAALRSLRQKSLRSARQEDPSLTISIGMQKADEEEPEEESEETAEEARLLNEGRRIKRR